jgi:hypothetical protein
VTEPTEVEARFDADGAVTVLSFTWRGSRLPVTGRGRAWAAEDGQHFLLMTTGERVFELTYDPARRAWRVAAASASRLTA